MTKTTKVKEEIGSHIKCDKLGRECHFYETRDERHGPVYRFYVEREGAVKIQGKVEISGRVHTIENGIVSILHEAELSV
jgi:hypothetical protein